MIKKTTLKSMFSGATLSLVLLASPFTQAEKLSKLEQAVASEQRTEKFVKRDQYRHPVETLNFFGFQPDMTVVELIPGGGWYTEILALALKDSGTLYLANYPDTDEDNYYSRSRKKLEKKVATNPLYKDIEITTYHPKYSNALAPKGTADLVLTFRNLHNFKVAGVEQMYQDAFSALKSGGVLGVVEHRLAKNLSWETSKGTGYFPQDLTIKLAEKAGFKLAASSEINANPKDTGNHPKGVWTLPPAFKLGDTDKDKYKAIGESDRMTLKFIKP